MASFSYGLIIAQTISYDSLCEGQDVNFSLNYSQDIDYIYQWQLLENTSEWINITDNDNISNSNTSQLTILDLNTSYNNKFIRCKVDTNQNGQHFFSDEILIIVNQILLPNQITTYQNVCVENASQLSVNSPYNSEINNHQWQLFNGEIDSLSNSQIEINLEDFKSDTLVLSVSNQCYSAQDTVFYTVFDSISDLVISDSQSICFGDSFDDLNVSVFPTGGDSIYNYQWEFSYNNFDWFTISDETDTILNPNFINTAAYFRLYTYSNIYCDSVYSNTVYLEVYDPLESGVLSSDQIICYSTSPEELSFSVLPSGSAGLSDYVYQWQESTDLEAWEDVFGATSSTLSAGVLTQTTYYRVRVSSLYDCGVVFTEPLSVSVYDEQQNGSILGSDSICQFQIPYNVQIELSALGGAPLYQYNWQFSDDGSLWSEIPNSNLVSLPDSSLTDTTFFRVEFVNSCGNLISNSIKVIVWPLPEEVSIVGNIEPCSNAYNEYYQSSLYSEYYFYNWNIDNGEITSSDNSFEQETHWYYTDQQSNLALNLTNVITGCERQITQPINIQDGLSPEKTEIIRINNSNILVCSDSTDNLTYEWGYDDIVNGETVYLENSNNRYVQLDQDFDNERYNYFVLTSFDYDQYSCSTISYYDIDDDGLGVFSDSPNSISIFPNPFISEFYLLDISNESVIEMFNLLGSRIKIDFNSENKKVTVLDLLNSGVYFVRIKNKSDILTIKLVKQ